MAAPTWSASFEVLSGFDIDPVAIYVTYPSRGSLTSAGCGFLAMLDEASAAMVPYGASGR